MPAMTKRVNVRTVVAVRTINPPISGTVSNVIMSTSDILKCLCRRAIVDEVLPNGKTVRLNMRNYYLDNGAGLDAYHPKASEAPQTESHNVGNKSETNVKFNANIVPPPEEPKEEEAPAQEETPKKEENNDKAPSEPETEVESEETVVETTSEDAESTGETEPAEQFAETTEEKTENPPAGEEVTDKSEALSEEPNEEETPAQEETPTSHSNSSKKNKKK